MNRRTALATAATITMVLAAGGAAAQATGVLGGERVGNRDIQPVATVDTAAPTPSSAETAPATRSTLPPVVVTRQVFEDTVVVVTSAPSAGAPAPSPSAPPASGGRTASSAATAPPVPTAPPVTGPSPEPTSPTKVTAPPAGADGPPATFRNPDDDDDQQD